MLGGTIEIGAAILNYIWVARLARRERTDVSEKPVSNINIPRRSREVGVETDELKRFLGTRVVLKDEVERYLIRDFPSVNSGYTMNSKPEVLRGFLKDQIVLENDNVSAIEKSVKEIENMIVRTTLHGISFDSMKHAELYRSAVGLLSGFEKALNQEEYIKIQEVIRKHIEIEELMLRRVIEAMSMTENKNVRFLLESIAADEKRHHDLLVKIRDTLVRGQTITEDEWWEFIWGSVPFHGAPD